MVTVVNYEKMKNSEGEEFIVLTVQGAPEVVISEKTNKPYFTVRKCNVPCTFDELTAKSLIYQQMPGHIVKVKCEPYDYTVESSGEVIELSHRWEYSVEEQRSAKEVNSFQLNGALA